MRFIFLLILFLIPFTFAVSQNEIRKVNGDDLERIINNRGDKILLINIWATWCIPCREEFPDLVKLADKYKREIEIVAVSVDYEDEIESKVQPFLSENNVNFKVHLNGFNKDHELIEFFNKEWNGALPGTFIYDKKGKQVKFIEGKRSFESFSSIIDQIISKS